MNATTKTTESKYPVSLFVIPSHMSMSDSPAHMIDMAVQGFAEIQDAYTAGHDAVDEVFANTFGKSGEQIKAEIDATQTEEFLSAHARAVWAINTVALYSQELTRRVGEGRTAEWIANRIARHGVTVEMVQR